MATHTFRLSSIALDEDENVADRRRLTRDTAET
jgi:hypothetical protein